MSNIQKSKSSTPAENKSKSDLEISIGDIFIHSRSEEAKRIYRIEVEGKGKNKYSKYYYEWLSDVLNKEWTISTGVYSNTGETFYNSIGGDDLKNYYDKVSEKDFDIWVEQARKFIETGELVGFDQANDESLNNEYALIGSGSKEHLIVMQGGLEEKKNQLEGMERIVSLQMEKQRRMMQDLRHELNDKLEVFKKQIKRIMRVITTIELYLGIDEEIVQIQEGEKAPVNTPITFRQRILYMDEEVANTEHGGLDYMDIDKFDGWLMEGQNYKNLLPEPKGIIVFNPRRKDKHYDDDALRNRQMNVPNYDTYMLIRNGDCLYRIYTDKITIYPRLFPQKNELMDLLKKVKETESYFSKKDAEEKVEDMTYQYKTRAILLQGLIDRTEILHPLPKKVSIFKMEEAEGLFNFVYDDEVALPDGRLRFWEWVAENNLKIEHGSRVILTGEYSDTYSGRQAKHWIDRLFGNRVNDWNLPPLPQKGLYEVERYSKRKIDWHRSSEFKKYVEEYEYKDVKIIKEYSSRAGYLVTKFDYEESSHLTIMHNPKDTGGWKYVDKEKVNRVRWKVFEDDRFVVNYDQISLDDIDFYLTNRADRENYLDMMPMLRELKKWRLMELENEKHFVAMVVNQISTSSKKQIPDLESKVWKSVEWWKFKNQVKRPIDNDDAKALRMIMKNIMAKSK